MPSFDEIVEEVGYLTDRQIQLALNEGHLLEEGSWDESCVRHASYTLRLGDRVEIARANASATSDTKEFTVVRLTATEPRIEIRPGDTALLYSLERLQFPRNVLGFTVARGLLFAEALSPENTYVDPGFTGTLYTTITNVSTRVVHLDYRMTIARLFFFKLSEAVEDGYRTGSALGISQQLQSVRATTIGSPDEVRHATDKQLLDCVRLIPLGGVHAAEALQRIRLRQSVAQRRLWIAAISWPVLLVLANGNPWLRDNVGPFAGSVLAGLVTTVLTFLAPKVIAWLRPEQAS
jgi:deoxycytidine triphosphate deaminase